MPQISKGTRSTPEIFFYQETNEWVISGRSYSLEVYETFEPVLNWLASCEKNKIRHCVFRFKLIYFSTTSFKIIFEIIQRLKILNKKGITTPSIKWHHESDDEDILEYGHSLKLISGLPFEFITHQV